MLNRCPLIFGKHKTLRLECDEFIRRFLQHVLPDGFMRIRHYGFLANRCRQCNVGRLIVITILPPQPAQGGEAARRLKQHK